MLNGMQMKNTAIQKFFGSFGPFVVGEIVYTRLHSPEEVQNECELLLVDANRIDCLT
jgi:hypothetical protein